MVIINKLNNGMRVVMEEIPYVRSISFGVWVKNGSRNENAEESGISHFIEHMLFKGSEARGAKEIAEAMDAIGGQINAYTTKEYTCYHTRTLDKHFERSLDIISDMLLNPKFDENEIKKEANVILEEINMYEDTPEDLVHEILQASVWPGALGRPILGMQETISSFTSEKIRQYFLRNYHNENTVISVAGNFKSGEILNLLNKYLGYRTQDYSGPEAVYDATYHPSFVTKEKNIGQVHICLAFPSIKRDVPEKFAYTVFNTIFGGGMSSRLFQRIREESGLTYSVYSYNSAYQDTGIFAIYASMAPNQIKRVIELMFKEISDAKKEKFSEKLINSTKESIISNFIIGNESTVNRMTSIGGQALLKNKVDMPEKTISEIERLRPSDIENVPKGLFNYDKISFSAVGNIAGIDFEGMIKNATG